MSNRHCLAAMRAGRGARGTRHPIRHRAHCDKFSLNIADGARAGSGFRIRPSDFLLVFSTGEIELLCAWLDS
ncbi:MAG: hypothetical protein ACM3ZE_29760, partial [Myxococcales bacterium]